MRFGKAVEYCLCISLFNNLRNHMDPSHHEFDGEKKNRNLAVRNFTCVGTA